MDTIIEQKPVNQTKFFGVIMNEAMNRARPAEKGVIDVLKEKDISVGAGDIDFSKALEDVNYIRSVLGEIERRRLFAIMCMTPDKIARESAKGLGTLIKDLSVLGKDLNIKLKQLESRINEQADKSNNLTEDAKKRIDKFLQR